MIDHKIYSLKRVDQSNDRMIEWLNRKKSNQRKQRANTKPNNNNKKSKKYPTESVYILRMNTETNSIMQAIQYKKKIIIIIPSTLKCAARVKWLSVGRSSLFSQRDYVATESE